MTSRRRSPMSRQSGQARKSDGKFAIRPVWAFCGDAKTQREMGAQALAKEASEEIDAAGMRGLVLFPSDENLSARTGETCALGLNLFSADVDVAFTLLEDYLKGVLS